MGFLEDVGRTNTLPAVTNNIANFAATMRQQDIQERRVAVQENLASMQINEYKEQKRRSNKLIPVDQALAMFPVPTVGQYFLKTARGLDYIKNVGGVDMISAGNSKNLLDMAQIPEQAKKINAMTLNFWRTQYQAGQKEIAAYQESKNGKDLSQDKTFIQMQEDLKKVLQARNLALQQTDQFDTVQKLQEDYTPAGLEYYRQYSEMPPASMRKDANSIVAVKDLKNGYAVHTYGDGREVKVKKEANEKTDKFQGSDTWLMSKAEDAWIKQSETKYGLRKPSDDVVAKDKAKFMDSYIKAVGTGEQYKRWKDKNKEVDKQETQPSGIDALVDKLLNDMAK